jgi:uncharacterized protein (TIGR02147 family)
MPDLYSYIDYRKFLKDYYEEQKARDPKFSHRYFTMKVGFSSSGYFSDVLAGKKNLSGAFMLKFAKALKLGKEEEEYFVNLVCFNQAKTLDEKNRYYEKMMTTGKVKVDIVDRDKHEYFSSWSYAAVREALHYLAFSGDFKALGKALDPPLSAKEAKKAIDVLAALGLIARAGDGTWRPTSGNLKMGGATDGLSLSNYHKSTLELAVRALDAFPPGQRGFSTLTLPLTAEKIRKAKLAIKNLRMYLWRSPKTAPMPIAYANSISRCSQ